MARAVMERHHVLQQNVGQESIVLRELIGAGRFDINATENLLFLSRDEAIAEVTGTVRHAGNHAPIEDFQKSILSDFAEQRTPSGKTYAQLMELDPSVLSPADQALRAQIFDQAEQLALDLRDYTAQSLLEGDLPLSKSDPRYAGLSDAAADAAWRQDIAEVFGDGPDGFEAGRDNLTAYRNEMNTIRAAHGDLRWRAFDTQHASKYLPFPATFNELFMKSVGFACSITS